MRRSSRPGVRSPKRNNRQVGRGSTATLPPFHSREPEDVPSFRMSVVDRRAARSLAPSSLVPSDGFSLRPMKPIRAHSVAPQVGPSWKASVQSTNGPMEPNQIERMTSCKAPSTTHDASRSICIRIPLSATMSTASTGSAAPSSNGPALSPVRSPNRPWMLSRIVVFPNPSSPSRKKMRLRRRRRICWSGVDQSPRSAGSAALRA